MKQLFIVDDHPAIRHGLGSLLTRTGWNLALEAGSVAEAKAVYRLVPWDLCILDLNLPDGDGLEFLRQVRQTGYLAPVLIHSMAADREVGVRVLKAGANGFVHKGSLSSELLAAVARIEDGDTYISAELGSALAGRMARGHVSALHEILSKRETEVMMLLGKGMTITAIASSIGLSANTVSTYRARILEKLKLDNTLELIRYLIVNKLAG